MYPSKGSGAYAQKSYSGQQTHVQAHGAGDVGGQRAMASRQPLVPSSQDTDLSGYSAHYEQGTQYGGPYASVYGSTTLSGHQVGGKGTASSGVHNDEYVPASSHAYSQKADPYSQKPDLYSQKSDLYSQKADAYSQKSDPYSLAKGSDYDSVDRRHYADQSSYLGIELQNDAARRYADPLSMRQRQVDTHDRMDPATLLREQQMLRAAQPLHSGSDARQSEYLAARAAPVSSYGGRLETVDPRSLPILGSTPYNIQHAPSASHLGGALRRSIDDLYATHGTAGVTAPYGVGLPPGRDYISGKGLLTDSDYLAHPMSLLHDRKDDRAVYRRELERDEEHRRELLRAKEKDREREEKEREERELKRERERRDRDKEREREKERDREREREREWERERERERERNRRRSLDRRDRERERSLQKLTKDLPTRRLTPRRPSPRRASPPRHEAVHRHRSSFREREREYTCKVLPFCLVEAERDYLSLSKRYPRLYVSPECSKVVLHWPKQNLHMSLHTPVSFEHEYVELDGQSGKKALVPSDKISELKHQNTIWSAKVLLMSGMDSAALNNMRSYKSSEDKIVHFYNVMRFAMLKKDSSLLAIGGPWDAEIDGGDPSVEDASLIKTAQRHLKDTTALDLQFCQHWNRFLEIHYDRIGEDGLFSHKEVTVLYVPDLSESLPSLDTWRTQWLEHRKKMVERERQKSLKDKKSSEKKELDQGRNAKDPKTDSEVKVKNETKIPDETKGTPKKFDKGTSDTECAPKNCSEENAIVEKGKELIEEPKEENADVNKSTIGDNKPKTTVKRKIIKRVIKGKTAGKQETKEAKEVKDVNQEVTPVLSPMTSAEKKDVKKSPSVKPGVKADNQEENNMQKESNEAPNAQEGVTKAKGKKKIIRRVIKKKVPVKKEAGSEEKEAKVKEDKELKVEVKEEKQLEVEAMEEEFLNSEKSNSIGKKEKDEKDIKKESKINEQNPVAESADKDLEKTSGSKKKEKTKDDKEKKSKDNKHQKEIKEKEKLDEPPEYPGLFLQTKREKGSKIRSMSLSLGGLLDYNDKDVEESTFELSVFAEAFSEMLQYQMACCLLSFLQKLRKRSITKKNQRKRQRDEKSEKDNKSSSPKQRKLSEGTKNQNQSSNSKKQGTKDQSGDVQMGEAEDNEQKNEVEEPEENIEDDTEEPEENIENENEEPDESEEPEEDVENDEEMKDAADDGGTKTDDNLANKDNANAVSEKSNSEVESAVKAAKSDAKLKAEKSDKEKRVKSECAIDAVYDKELLQAFRFFDYNRVGYIKVEDLRCLLHNLGMFLSYRDVKELVQCALLESNTAMDNRIFYKKLVTLTEL